MSTAGGDGGLEAENARLRARVEALERRLGEAAPPPAAQASASGPRVPFEALFELLPMPVFVYRTDGLLAAVNEACCTWFKVPREHVVDRFNLLQDAEAVAQGFTGPFLRAVGGEVTTLPATPYEMVENGAEGRLRRCWLEVTYLPLRDEAEVRFVVSLTRDVTAHKEAEAQQRRSAALLEAIIDNAPLHIYARDAEGRYVVANRQVEAAFGRPRGGMLGARRHRHGSRGHRHEGDAGAGGRLRALPPRPRRRGALAESRAR
ncbi:PAS domain-containing protein [Sorangium sp. So ce260]|uniref:PAS domain-containing protein n=1 Tax=Sorangium sp. So ce260 TaxID=3133291 RepID=UPI003F60C881